MVMAEVNNTNGTSYGVSGILPSKISRTSHRDHQENMDVTLVLVAILAAFSVTILLIISYIVVKKRKESLLRENATEEELEHRRILPKQTLLRTSKFGSTGIMCTRKGEEEGEEVEGLTFGFQNQESPANNAGIPTPAISVSSCIQQQTDNTTCSSGGGSTVEKAGEEDVFSDFGTNRRGSIGSTVSVSSIVSNISNSISSLFGPFETGRVESRSPPASPSRQKTSSQVSACVKFSVHLANWESSHQEQGGSSRNLSSGDNRSRGLLEPMAPEDGDSSGSLNTSTKISNIQSDSAATSATVFGQPVITNVLTIKLVEVQHLPPRDYSSIRDPYAVVTVVQYRKVFRRRPKQLVAKFTTEVLKHRLHPMFNETFCTVIHREKLKDIEVKISVFDRDRHTKTTEIGSTSVFFKQMTVSEHPMELKQNLTFNKQSFGKILLGLNFLPTARRLAFTVSKVFNLKHDEVVNCAEELRSYVRIQQVSSKSGKVLRTLKTSVKYGMKNPTFNETLNFDVTSSNTMSSVFIVLVFHRLLPEETAGDEKSIESKGAASRMNGGGEFTYLTARERKIQEANLKYSGKNDFCLGMVCFGKNVRGVDEKSQFLSAILHPRKVVSEWHDIH